MTRPTGPDFIALQVRNLAASTTFYRETFGFELEAKGPPGAVVFKTRPIALALREPLRPLPDTGPLGVGMVLWVACDDADALHDLIVTRGGRILSPVANGPFGRFFVAADPDGYAITFHTGHASTTTLDPAAGHSTLINTFTVEPEKAQALLESLSKATEDVFLPLPGFVSANLHMSDDQRHVTNYAQWRSKKDYDDAMKSPVVQSHIREAAQLASSFNPIFYALAKVHTASEKRS